MAPNYKVQVVDDPAGLAAWTAAQYSAFNNTGNVLADALFPPSSSPTPAQIAQSAERHIAALKADPEHVVFVQIVDPADGKVMGGAKWQFWSENPKHPANVPVDYIDDSTPEGKAELAFAQKVMDELMGRRARDMAVPQGVLDLCYTVPAYERKGVASALVIWGLEWCDREGVVAFTEASPRGWPVYERLGFERKEVVRLRYDELGDYAKSLDDVVWTYMVRPARRKE